MARERDADQDQTRDEDSDSDASRKDDYDPTFVFDRAAEIKR